MKKVIYTISLLCIAFMLTQCTKRTNDLSLMKKQCYDSARKVIIDSLHSRTAKEEGYKALQKKVYKPEEIKHSPPDDGHVHDGGFDLTGKSTTQDYVSGIMHRVIDMDHNKVIATIPFIVKKGQIKKGDDYITDKKKHAHLAEYDLVEVPLIDPATGATTGQTILVAVVKRVIPK